MTYTDRIHLYEQIEKIRNRPLICYITSTRPNLAVEMSADVIPEIIKQLILLPQEMKEVDLLIISNGGDAMVSWRIISMLREKVDKIGVLVPNAAYSAATLVALGADEIVMHPFSNLGPVDPQLTYRRRIPGQQGQSDTIDLIQFGSEDLRNFLEFVRKDVGISDQEQLERAFELVCKEVGSIPIGVAKRSAQLSLSIGEKLLSTHMEDTNKAKAIAVEMSTSFYYHGYPLGPKEVEKIGLPIVRPEKELERLLWEVWESIEQEMETNKPYNPLDIVLQSQDVSQLLVPVPQVQIPANLPSDLLEQVYNNVLQQISVVEVPPVDYELFLAAVESVRGKSHYKEKGKIQANRLPDMNIAINIVPVLQGWQYEPAA